MKVAYKHLLNFIPSKPSIDEISQKFFQLGHEHEVINNIFDIEVTPNRGDCLSINGLLRELAVFYEIKIPNRIYEENIEPLELDFINNCAPEICPRISFLKIDIKDKIKPYHGLLKEYFDDLDVNKNNFFTDVSNYISYETGQPTHCYDAKKLQDTFSLQITQDQKEFETLLGEKINLKGKNLIFSQENNVVINLAGVMGGYNTACSDDSHSVIVECAEFNPENILGQSIKYDIKSDAAFKFERGVDPACHDKVLRRFIKIVEDHATITNIKIISKEYHKYDPVEVQFNFNQIKSKLGIALKYTVFEDYLSKLGFIIKKDKILVPSFRNDIKIENDIVEEIARIIGYDNIPAQPFSVSKLTKIHKEPNSLEIYTKDILKSHGFFETINNPFTNIKTNKSIIVDNPLDSTKQFLRTTLEESLVNNLLFNERRQHDSIKLFEISDIYFFDEKIKHKKMLGIICSGKVGRNYLDFSKKINLDYLLSIVKKISTSIDLEPKFIDRSKFQSKSNTPIVYIEVELDSIMTTENIHKVALKKIDNYSFVKYRPISEYPSSLRDLSFSIKDMDNYSKLQDLLLNYENELIKEVFVFDFFVNKKNNEIKIGFRFIFQSKISTITEKQVNDIMDHIVKSALKIESVSIPGLIE